MTEPMEGPTSWPKPPREPGPWAGGPPIAPAGNTPLPPLPGPGGVSRTTAVATNPWTNAGAPGPPPPPPVPTSGPRPPFPGLQSDAVPRIDRAPRWIIAVSALVVLGLVAGTGYVTLKSGKQYPSEWDARVAPIASWVAKSRELDFKHPVEVQFLTDAEYRDVSTGGDSSDAPDDGAMDDVVAQLRALGLVEGKVDLEEAGNTLSDSGTLAFYDPSTEQVYIRGNKMTPSLRVTLAHELTHVLQDQHFDLERMADLPESQGTVLRALAEGDAGRIEDRYVDEVLSPAERTAHEKDSAESGKDATDAIDKSVPPILTAMFASPYIFGPALVTYLEQRGGSELVDEAFDEVPREEALFNPLVYDTDAAKGTQIDFKAPSGSEELESGEFGPTAWYLLLASRMAPKQALQATDGMHGDGYVVYRYDKKVCVQIRAKGEKPDDLVQLSKALTSWAAKSPAGSAVVDTVGDQVRFQSCDPGAKANGAGSVSVDLLTVPATRTQVYNSVMETGQVSEEQASCYATAIIETFSAKQLTDPTFGQSPAGTMAIQQLQARCF